MKGFKITFNGKTIEIAAEFGISVFAHQRNANFHVSVGGIEIKSDNHMVTHSWIDSEMLQEESIEIEIIDVQKNSEQGQMKVAFSCPTVLTKNEIEEMFVEKLNNFHALERLLKKEGLI